MQNEFWPVPGDPTVFICLPLPPTPSVLTAYTWDFGNPGRRDDAPAPPAPPAAPAPVVAPAPPAGSSTPSKTDQEYCAGHVKRRLAGRTGTPFGRCVSAMAKLRDGRATKASKACAGQSRRRVRGMRRSPYRTCVTAGTALLRDLARQRG